MIIVKQLSRLVTVEFRLILREPETVFFSFILPLFFLFIVMEVFIPLDVPREIFANHVVPSLSILVITSNAMFNVPAVIASYREIKFFKRLKASPIPILSILGGVGAANFIITTIGILLLIAGGKLIYGAEFEGNIMTFLFGFLLILLSINSLCLIIASVCRTPRVAATLASIIYFPILFFSGVFVPLEMLPDWIVRYISPLMPMTYAVELLRGLWLGYPISDFVKEIITLIGCLVLGLIISVKTFRWE